MNLHASTLIVNRLNQPLILLAQSARLLAASSRQALSQPRLVVDAFADLDAQACASSTRQVAWQAEAVTTALQDTLAEHPSAAVVYGSGCEAMADVLESPLVAHQLAGNTAAVLRRCSQPKQWFALLDQLQLPYPAVSFELPNNGDWLCKRSASCGGVGVSRLPADRRLYQHSDDVYYQRLLAGQTVSLLFLANGQAMLPVGFSAQWHREQDFVWLGAHSAPILKQTQREDLCEAAKQLSTSLGLKGLNTLDVMIDDDQIQLLELNPRPSATMALHENVFEQGLLYWHLQACEGRLPRESGRQLLPTVQAMQEVFAVNTLQIPTSWQWPEYCHDLSPPGTAIKAGEPVCTIEISALTTEQALDQLNRLTSDIQQQLAQRQVA